MKVYIAGPITGNPNYKKTFGKAEQILKEKGAIVMNPAVLPEGWDWQEYMVVTVSMLQVCDTIALLPGWEKSRGANFEYDIARMRNKKILEFTSDYQLKSHIYTPNRNNH